MTAFVVCLSVAAGAMAIAAFFMWVALSMRKSRDWWKQHSREWRNVAYGFQALRYDAAQNERLWQSIQDRLAVDALVGPSTYEGGE